MFSFDYPSEPQTPTRSSTAPIFGDSFQTPKLESSFFDPRVTWDTSDPYASSPDVQRTPRRFVGNPGRHAGAEAGVKSTKISTDPKRIRSSKSNAGLGDGPQSSKSAASMQTPPPSSASRSKVPELGSIHGSAKRRSINAPEHLETPSRLMGNSPRLFSNLQSSPDLFQLGSIDPSSSPFFPQQRLFWDQEQPHANDAGFSDPNMDPFGSTGAENIHLNQNPMQDLHMLQMPSMDNSLDFPEFNSRLNPPSAPADAALFPAPFSTSPRLPTAKADDPSMFLSSPARRFGGPQQTPEKGRLSKPARQPYHHQAEESKREELRRSQLINRGPGFYDDDDEDDEPTPRQRPGLTRSATHTAVTRPQRPATSAGMMASTSRIRKSPSKGRSSPVKSVHPPLSRTNSVAASRPTRSQSVVLKVGKDGRAKTEMQTVTESPTGLTDPITGMELEETADSEYDSADFPLPGHLPRSESDSRPPSKGSTIASSHSGRVSPWTGSRARQSHGPSPEKWRRTPKRHSVLANSDLTQGTASSASDSVDDEDSGDAQHALRKVLQERGRNRPSTGYGFPPNPPSFGQFRSSPPRLGSELDMQTREPNTSPTTVTDPDLATPTTDRYSNPSVGTRCICNSMDNGGHLMIQWFVLFNLQLITLTL